MSGPPVAVPEIDIPPGSTMCAQNGCMHKAAIVAIQAEDFVTQDMFTIISMSLLRLIKHRNAPESDKNACIGSTSAKPHLTLIHSTSWQSKRPATGAQFQAATSGSMQRRPSHATLLFKRLQPERLQLKDMQRERATKNRSMPQLRTCEPAAAHRVSPSSSLKTRSPQASVLTYGTAAATAWAPLTYVKTDAWGLPHARACSQIASRVRTHADRLTCVRACPRGAPAACTRPEPRSGICSCSCCS